MKQRLIQTEKLDNLSLDGKELHEALRSLAWVNKWLGNHQIIIQAIYNVIRAHPEKEHFRMIDLGCGGGDVALELAKKLQKEGCEFSITGIDGNANSLNYAQEKSKDFPQINYQQADILSPDFVVNSCDILISSHFIYHFQSPELIRFLQKNLPNIRLAFINSGLERNSLAFALFKRFGFLLPISQLARTDGLLAIRRAFTKNELMNTLSQTPNLDFQLKRVPLFRLKMVIIPQT